MGNVTVLPPIEKLWDMYQELGSVHKIETTYGIGHARVHRALKKAGYILKGSKFTIEEDEVIRRYYADTSSEEFDLNVLVAQLPNRQNPAARQNICRRARELGLTDQRRSPSVKAREATSVAVKKTLAEKGHPRGFLGKSHSEETRAVIATKSQESWSSMSEEKQAEKTLKMLKTKSERGNIANPRPKTSWKAAWHHIGGRRIYFRSQWEVNYAHYLEWLKANGQIKDWEFEPQTFWFDGIKRGAMSYLPDFRVTEIDGRCVYHEIKGWMDDRSKTKIRRMAKYHPQVKLLVIDAPLYRALARKAKGLVPGWQ